MSTRHTHRLVLLGALLVVAGPADLTSGLSDPSRGGLALVLVLGLTAGISTCMAMVGGLVLGFSASHAAALAARGETGLPFATSTALTVPACGAVIGFITFIASMISSVSPAPTLLPTPAKSAAPGSGAR